jgi:hypothetical protein
MVLSGRLTQPITATSSGNRQYQNAGRFEHVNEKVTDADDTEPKEVQATVCTESTEVSETQF